MDAYPKPTFFAEATLSVDFRESKYVFGRQMSLLATVTVLGIGLPFAASKLRWSRGLFFSSRFATLGFCSNLFQLDFALRSSVAMAMSRVASLRPNGLLSLLRTQACMSTDATSAAEKVLKAANLQPGDVLVQNEADSELGKAFIKAAKQKGFTTINILPNKPGVNDSIELLKSIGGDVVVTEAYTNTWYMKRLISDLPKPSVGINCGEGSQATAVVKLLKEGGTLLTYGKRLPQEVTYPGADRRPLKWNDLLKGKKLNVQSL